MRRPRPPLQGCLQFPRQNAIMRTLYWTKCIRRRFCPAGWYNALHTIASGSNQSRREILLFAVSGRTGMETPGRRRQGLCWYLVEKSANAF